MPAEKTGIAARLFRAAWLSIALGLAIEVALLIVALAFGKYKQLDPFIADLAGKLSWSVLVCVGISIGTVANKTRGPVMGVLGLLSAPLAFTIAKAAHKTVAQALAITGTAASVPTAGQMIALRVVEYAVLGWIAGWASTKPFGTLRFFAALGLVTGAAAAGVVVLLTVQGTASGAVPVVALVSKSVNEILFPLGCALVLYAVNMLDSRTRLVAAV